MNKKSIIACIALALVVAAVVGIYFATRPGSKSPETPEATAEGGKTFTLFVVHGDGTEKELTITSDEEFLAHALIHEGIINDEGLETGMYFTVDGETASWEENQSYWAIYLGEEYASYGLNDTAIEEGAVYRLVYTIG